MTPFADLRFMDAALALARAGLGTTAPNPSVGCVLVQNGRIVGAGTTAPGGRPHAETIALAQAGRAARGATAYVTLEPCAHTGVTPPCADALIEAGVWRVVIACPDKDVRVDGRGAQRLSSAGICVVCGIRQDAALALNTGFFSVLERGRPFVGIDDEPRGYDLTLEAEPQGELTAMLEALAQSGHTRVRARPGTGMAQALSRANLVDCDAQTGTTSR